MMLTNEVRGLVNKVKFIDFLMQNEKNESCLETLSKRYDSLAQTAEGIQKEFEILEDLKKDAKKLHLLNFSYNRAVVSKKEKIRNRVENLLKSQINLYSALILILWRNSPAALIDYGREINEVRKSHNYILNTMSAQFKTQPTQSQIPEFFSSYFSH